MLGYGAARRKRLARYTCGEDCRVVKLAVTYAAYQSGMFGGIEAPSMTENDRSAPLLCVLSTDAENLAAAARGLGWLVVTLPASEYPADGAGCDAMAIDLRGGGQIPQLSDGVSWIALVDATEAGGTAAMFSRGATHVLTWPADAQYLAGTLNAARAVRERLTCRGAAQAGEDSLTGLPARSAARAWLDAGLSNESAGGVSACLLIGISQFASVNAAYGQQAGDAALARAAGRIERCARAMTGEGGLVARMGGTEYLIACPDFDDAAGRPSPKEIARQVLVDLSRPFVAGDRVIRLTARCGIALPVPGDDASSLLRRASAALAAARRSSTQEVVQHSGLRGSGRALVDDHDRLDADLRLALDRGEIGIVYQPQYDSRNDRIVGVEALARWNHPRLGQLDAGTLFEAADRSDTLLPLSQHIQRTALTEAGQWPAALAKLRLSINVTAADVAHEGFVPHLLATIDESGFPHNRLTIEITETGLIENIGRAAAMLHALRQHGLSVAIDDFGTGYSSLAYLKDLHPDYLKIDPSMSRNITGTPRDRIILRAIIAMARSLALTVIAEGVESERQLDLLAREGCDIYQGFLRSPPVTSAELAELAR